MRQFVYDAIMDQATSSNYMVLQKNFAKMIESECGAWKLIKTMINPPYVNVQGIDNLRLYIKWSPPESRILFHIPRARYPSKSEITCPHHFCCKQRVAHLGSLTEMFNHRQGIPTLA